MFSMSSYKYIDLRQIGQPNAFHIHIEEDYYIYVHHPSGKVITPLIKHFELGGFLVLGTHPLHLQSLKYPPTYYVAKRTTPLYGSRLEFLYQYVVKKPHDNSELCKQQAVDTAMKLHENEYSLQMLSVKDVVVKSWSDLYEQDESQNN